MNEKRIAVYGVDSASGRLTELNRVAVEGTPGSLAVGPSRRFLYAGLGSPGTAGAG